MDAKALKLQLKRHALWRAGKKGGSRAVLTGADLIGENLAHADLSGADLSGVDLGSARMGYTNLSGANLSGASLTYSLLHGAKLCNADLTGAILTDADITNADLSGANVAYAKIDLRTATRANFSPAQLRSMLFGPRMRVTKPIVRIELQWLVYICDSHMKIGCQTHSHKQWAKFSDKRIASMHPDAPYFWDNHRDELLALCVEQAKQERK